jgi:hypothetical protein
MVRNVQPTVLRSGREDANHDGDDSVSGGAAGCAATRGARHARGHHGRAHRGRGRDASEAAITTPVVLGYTAVHLAGFILFGLAVSGLFALAEREKRVLALIFMLGCCLAVIFAAMVYGLSQWVRDAMTPWVFLAGHVLAGAAVVGALVYFHRRLLREFPTSAE